ADADDGAVFLDQPLDVGPEDEGEVRVLLRLGGEQFQQPGLRCHQDVRELGPQPVEVGDGDAAGRGVQGQGADGPVGELVEAVGEAELVEDFEGGRVDGVAAEVAVEGVVGFEQDDGDAAAGEQ